jgi:hypothetical protein
MGVDKVRIFTDSLCAIETLQKYSPYYKGQFSEGIEKIIKYCSNFELCEIIHIKRHHNATADSLTHF